MTPAPGTGTAPGMAELLARYNGGESVSRIAASLGVSRNRLRERLRASGAAIRKGASALTDAERRAVAVAYAAGKGAPTLAREFGVSVATIYSAARAHGVLRRAAPHASEERAVMNDTHVERAKRAGRHDARANNRCVVPPEWRGPRKLSVQAAYKNAYYDERDKMRDERARAEGFGNDLGHGVGDYGERASGPRQALRVVLLLEARLRNVGDGAWWTDLVGRSHSHVPPEAHADGRWKFVKRRRSESQRVATWVERVAAEPSPAQPAQPVESAA